jgi:hypothetical protein
MIDIFTSPIFLLILGILVVFATYFKGKKDGSQLDKIEKKSTETNALTTHIDNIQKLHLQLTNQIDTIVKENSILSHRANDLITQVQELTQASHNTLSSVETLTSKEFAQNAIQGKLNLSFDKPLKDQDSVTVIFGNSTTNYVWEWNKNGYIKIGDFDLINLKIINSRIVLSLVANDFLGNWLAEIDQNYWRRNQSQISKFNYDSKGFEIMNNKNKVCFSIDILSHNTIRIQGIFSFLSNRIIIVAHDDKFEWFSIGTNGDLQQNIFTQIEAASKINIKPLFSYTGDNWIGKRSNMN